MNGVTLLGILQLVRIDIGRERAGHVSRRHLRALRLAQERAELVLQRNRRGEDGRALLLRHAVLIRRLDATTTLRGLLDRLRDALLQALERLDGLHRLITSLLEDGNQLRNLLVDALRLNGLRRSRHARSNRCRRNRRRGGLGRRRRLLGNLLGLGRRRRRLRNWGI